MFEDELDFAPGLEECHRHVFIIYSLKGCTQCDSLFQAMKDAHALILSESTLAEISVFIKKIDVTDKVRSDKAMFVESMIDQFEYVARKDGKVMFPLCVYNGRFIGGYRECYGKFCSVMDEFL